MLITHPGLHRVPDYSRSAFTQLLIDKPQPRSLCYLLNDDALLSLYPSIASSPQQLHFTTWPMQTLYYMTIYEAEGTIPNNLS